MTDVAAGGYYLARPTGADSARAERLRRRGRPRALAPHRLLPRLGLVGPPHPERGRQPSAAFTHPKDRTTTSSSSTPAYPSSSSPISPTPPPAAAAAARPPHPRPGIKGISLIDWYTDHNDAFVCGDWTLPTQMG